jgi:hypothetical protein
MTLPFPSIHQALPHIDEDVLMDFSLKETTEVRDEILFVEGFLKDGFAKLCEPVQGRSFLYTGKRPTVGQSTETQLTFGNGEWCRLSGVVTAVGRMPTLKKWKSNTSYQACVKGQCTCPQVSPEQVMFELFAHDACLAGQTLESYAVLNFDFYHKEGILPIKCDRVYLIKYKVFDGHRYPWVVEQVTEVENLNDAPEAFHKWKQYWDETD